MWRWEMGRREQDTIQTENNHYITNNPSESSADCDKQTVMITITDPTEIEGRDVVSGKQSVSVKTITMFATFTEKRKGKWYFLSSV